MREPYMNADDAAAANEAWHDAEDDRLAAEDRRLKREASDDVRRCSQCDGHGEWGYSPESLHTCERCGGSGQEPQGAGS